MITGKVGTYEFEFASVPVGNEGQVHIKVGSGRGQSAAAFEARWRRDGQGIWLELPSGVHGFDIRPIREDGVVQYEAVERGGARSWSGMKFLRAGETEASASMSGSKSGKARIRAQMPGKIVKILVKAGDRVEKDQSLLVMEAMKMENEIKAPGVGVVGMIKVTEGQAIESGADLVLMESGT